MLCPEKRASSRLGIPGLNRHAVGNNEASYTQAGHTTLPRQPEREERANDGYRRYKAIVTDASTLTDRPPLANVK